MKVKYYLNKLQGYERFQDVLEAIQLVAASDYKDIKSDLTLRYDSLGVAKEFFHTIMDDLPSPNISNTFVFPFLVDKNCCGANNSNVFRTTSDYIDGLKEDKSDFFMFLSSLRGKEFFKVKYPRTNIQYILGADIDYISFLFCSYIFDIFNRSGNDQLSLIFNRMHSIFDIRCSVYELYSYDNWVNTLSSNIDTLEGKYSYFSHLLLNYKSLRDLYNFLGTLTLMDSFIENEYSSIGGRVNAISAACKNIKDVIEEARMLYNKARQESITVELLELSVHVI